MKKTNILIVIVLFFITACGDQPPVNTIDIPQDMDNDVTMPEDTQEDDPAALETPVPVVIEDTAVPSTETPTVAHITFPSAPGGITSWVLDTSSEPGGGGLGTSSDDFPRLRFERPFTSEMMAYQGHLDITRVELSVGSPFSYVTFFLNGAPPVDSIANYGIEFDIDKDGRGDWLIYAQVPSSSDWTTANVRAYRDSNNFVGGSIPINSDSGSTGYDELVFDRGYNTAHPDAAWVRRDPSNPNRVQIAFDHALIGSPTNYLWGGWADEGAVEPAWFDYNDHFTSAEAGSPNANSSEYPIKQLYSLDNTCRWTYGFTPTSNLPGMCFLPATPTPVPTATATATVTATFTPEPLGLIGGGVWVDANGNGVVTSGESGFGGVTVSLGQGSCASAGYKSTSTEGTGKYFFTGLSAGTYCVSVNIATVCGGWLSTTVTQHTAVLSPGEYYVVPWFGYTHYIC